MKCIGIVGSVLAALVSRAIAFEPIPERNQAAASTAINAAIPIMRQVCDLLPAKTESIIAVHADSESNRKGKGRTPRTVYMTRMVNGREISGLVDLDSGKEVVPPASLFNESLLGSCLELWSELLAADDVEWSVFGASGFEAISTVPGRTRFDGCQIIGVRPSSMRRLNETLRQKGMEVSGVSRRKSYKMTSNISWGPQPLTIYFAEITNNVFAATTSDALIREVLKRADGTVSKRSDTSIIAKRCMLEIKSAITAVRIIPNGQPIEQSREADQSSAETSGQATVASLSYPSEAADVAKVFIHNSTAETRGSLERYLRAWFMAPKMTRRTNGIWAIEIAVSGRKNDGEWRNPSEAAMLVLAIFGHGYAL